MIGFLGEQVVIMPTEQLHPLDTWNKWNSFGGPNYPLDEVVRFCFRNYEKTDRAKRHALDLGCGSGVHCAFLCNEGFEVTGVDFSETGISNTRKRLDKLGLTANLMLRSADDLPLPPKSIDLVICVGLFECCGPAVSRTSVLQLTTILKPDGRGIFWFASDRDVRTTTAADPDYPIYGYSENEVIDLFKSSFSEVYMDRSITTYSGGKIEVNNWLITVKG